MWRSMRLGVVYSQNDGVHTTLTPKTSQISHAQNAVQYSDAEVFKHQLQIYSCRTHAGLPEPVSIAGVSARVG